MLVIVGDMETKEFSVHEPSEFQSVISYIFDLPVKEGVAQVITLTGDLGAGKTTFTQELARYLQITEQVVSPTFVVMKGYEVPDNATYDQLIHIDAYRFEDESEAGPLRLTELFSQPRTLVCVEWPDRITNILPSDKIDVTISIANDEMRSVSVSR